jgi:diguanylate cyclase (GGDEF)-like protein
MTTTAPGAAGSVALPATALDAGPASVGAGAVLEPLAGVVPIVEGDTPIAEVDRLFAAERSLSAVIVRTARGFALLPRDHVQFELSGRYGYGRSLLSRARAADLLINDSLALTGEMSLTEAAQRILDRPIESRYQDVLVHTAQGPRTVPVSAVFEQLAVMFRHVAFHDPLTGLPNRRLLDEHAAELARRGFELDRIAILYVDLDGFKAVNDTFGHRAGDELLTAFADRLRSCVRAGDIVARLGGDEFAAMLIDVSEVEAMAIADRIVLNATAPFVFEDEPLHISASVGIAMADDVTSETEMSQIDVLLRHADGAMLKAKRAGKRQVGRLTLGSSAAGSALARAALVRRQLRHALNHDELRLAYQPILELDTGRLDTVEALLRWTDSELGEVSPAEFIPIAEHSGQIHRLGRFVLARVCAQAAAWWRAGSPRTVAVNVSPTQFADDTFLDDVLAALAEYDLPARFLRIEITEGAAIADPPRTIAALNRLQDAGVAVDLDDFGTGHSSLAMLRALPLTAVKIDKSFIDDIDSDTADRLLVEGVIGAAHALGLTVTAEGVERVEQLNALRYMRCDTVQGFLIARPTEPDALPANSGQQVA